MTKASGIIALLSDYGLQDAYVGVMKGALLSVNPEARIVDLTHEIPPQDVREGARVLAAARGYFPDGTIFVAVVDPGVGTERALVGVETDRQLFLAPDNGLLGFLGDSVQRRVRISQSKYFLKPLSNTFHGRDILAPLAGHLSRGIDLAEFGPALERLNSLDASEPRRGADGGVQGEVVAIDRFGNLITNIPTGMLPEGPDVRITVGRKVLRKLSRSYADVPKGGVLALVGSTGHLEIAVNQGSASKAARIRRGDRVLVTRSRR
ncbi:MAG TPA: SAM-dependent chlorinase/fluorinase [Planctomycetota bacterium]|nr:SAM-dependent chlorinase/fluorinase [Planctomycetota bacterium]